MFLKSDEKICSIVLFFALYIVRIIAFRYARKKEVKIDGKVCSPSDYTMMISGIPRETKPEEVIEHIEKTEFENGHKVKVDKINYSYYLGDFQKSVAQITAIRNKIRFEKGVEKKKQT